MKEIFIGIPNTGNIRTELVNWLFQITQDKNYIVQIYMPQNKPHDFNRNVIVDKFLKSNAEYLLMIDSDIVPTTNVLEMSKHKLDIVSAYIKTVKDNKIIPVAMNKNKKIGYSVVSSLTKGLNKVDAVGTGCIMIHRKVFDKINKPYFRFVYDDNGYLINGEDFDFCDRAKEQGIDIYIDTNHNTIHYTTLSI